MTYRPEAIERVQIDGATIRYRSVGDGRPVVFVHGVYVGGHVWDAVAARLEGVRCIMPTWALGAHLDPAPGADLGARAAARRIPAFLEELGLQDVCLVGNDTGGGLCLASLGTGHPGLARIGRLVLTNCDSYEHFPPKGFDRIAALARHSPPIVGGLLRLFATGPGRRMFFRSVCTRPPSSEKARELMEGFATSTATRADAVRLTASLEPSVTLDAVPALRAFDKPVLVVWGESDKLFPLDHAKRLAADFPQARLVTVPGASTFVMLDQPQAVAEAINSFVTGG